MDQRLAQFLRDYTNDGPEFIDENFAAQATFIRDPARRKVAFCTRRAGKSEGAGRYLLKEAFENPGCQVLYVGLTRGSAKAIMWGPILKRLCHQWGLDIRWNEVDLTGRLPNGSTLRLTGADANDGERQKLLGQRNRLVVLDECASFKPHIRNLVWDVLRPTTVDELGTMVACGTPGEVAAGWFYDITTGADPGWNLHRWTTSDNPYMRENFAEEFRELKEMDPDVELKPWFRRQYLGEWVTDTENLVYCFTHGINEATDLPPGRWTYGLGIDLGWNDDTAFVLCAWSPHDPNLYAVHCHKEPHLTFDKVDAKIRDLVKGYGTISHIVIDGAKQAVEDMRLRYGWNFQPPKKTNKVDNIGLVNTDLRLGKIKILPGAEPIITEWANLIWEKEKTPPREDPMCPNHLSDAFYYIHRHSRHYLGKEPDIKPSDPAKAAQWEIDKWQEQQIEDFETHQKSEWWE